MELMEKTVRTSIRFLDNVHSVSSMSVDRINEMTSGTRRLGLGVFSWADLLAEMDLPYDSEEARHLASFLSWFISFFAWQESMALAEEKGTFRLYEKDKVDLSVVKKVFDNEFCPFNFDLESSGYRNVAVTAIAPTGTLALLADKNSAIEPFFLA